MPHKPGDPITFLSSTLFKIELGLLDDGLDEIIQACEDRKKEN